VVELDHRAAIALAIGSAGEGDVVLVAGKGHETVRPPVGHRPVRRSRSSRVRSRSADGPERSRLAAATGGRRAAGDPDAVFVVRDRFACLRRARFRGPRRRATGTTTWPTPIRGSGDRFVGRDLPDGGARRRTGAGASATRCAPPGSRRRRSGRDRLRPGRRGHRLGGQDGDQGPHRGRARAPVRGACEPGFVQQRSGSPAHLAARARAHRGGGAGDGRALSWEHRGAVCDRAAERRRDHQDRPRPCGPHGRYRGCRPHEGRAARRRSTRRDSRWWTPTIRTRRDSSRARALASSPSRRDPRGATSWPTRSSSTTSCGPPSCSRLPGAAAPCASRSGARTRSPTPRWRPRSGWPTACPSTRWSAGWPRWNPHPGEWRSPAPPRVVIDAPTTPTRPQRGRGALAQVSTPGRRIAVLGEMLGNRRAGGAEHMAISRLVASGASTYWSQWAAGRARRRAARGGVESTKSRTPPPRQWSSRGPRRDVVLVRAARRSGSCIAARPAGGL
jgi:hypothetical protein